MKLQDEILEFWFGPGDDPWEVDEEISSRWFGGGESFDAEIRERFGEDLECAIRGEYDDWPETPRGRLALILIFDQFSRNIFRDSPRAWSQDLLAQKLTLEGMADGVDDELRPIEQCFFYLPLEHAEDLQLQRMSLREFTRLADDAPYGAALGSEVDRYAERHFEIIERFGRFPHRNEVIGRPTTPEEAEFLKQPNSSF